jgi:predicted site-specific integrase-resolvase
VTPLCVDRKTAAAALGVSRWVLDRYIAEGRLPVVKLPSTRHSGEASRRVLIAADDLQAFVERHRRGVTR